MTLFWEDCFRMGFLSLRGALVSADGPSIRPLVGRGLLGTNGEQP